MSRYIYVDKLIKDGWKLRREKSGLTTITFETMELDCVPTANVRENVRGEWIDTGSGQECSVCKEVQYGYDNFRNFCPNCGAEMQ